MTAELIAVSTRSRTKSSAVVCKNSLRFRAIGIGFAMHRPDRPAAAASADANAETIDAAMSISGVFE